MNILWTKFFKFLWQQSFCLLYGMMDYRKGKLMCQRLQHCPVIIMNFRETEPDWNARFIDFPPTQQTFLNEFSLTLNLSQNCTGESGN